MAEPSPHLFVSYASADLARVQPAVAELEGAGARVWLDREGIPGGTVYGPEIVAAIRESAAVVLCCTAAAFASRNVRQEVALAWKHERPILPLLLEPAPIPDELAYWLEGTQWIEVLDRPREAWLPEIIAGLRELGIAVAPPPAVPADGADPATAIWLPTPLTALLGREAEVREVADLLASHRLVTLTGPGGVGKTRLAIEAARAAVEAFPDGGAFVELAAVRDPTLVIPTVAKALGVREMPGVPLADVVSAAIGERRRLLVLDNLEHLVEAAPAIAALLVACPRAAVLATSRAPLAVRGERILPVEPLPVPAPDAPIADLLASPGVRLFAERAAEARPGFVLTAETVPDVAAICARLDGLPLAIELAAARAKLLAPEALLAKLGSRLPLLTGGPRDLPARQQTLRDAIAWSHYLLTPEEQAVFRRLAVFAGGWSFEAAEAVCDPDGALGLFECLASLVDECMVRQEGASLPEARFGMLETIREYGGERLAASGEEEALRGRHAVWFVAVAEEAERSLYGRWDAQWLDRLDADHPNLRAALAWTIEHGEATVALRLAAAVAPFWFYRGHITEGRRWLERALALDGAADPDARVAVFCEAGRFARRQGDHTRAQELGDEGLALARATGDDLGTCRALHALGELAGERGETARAVALYDEAYGMVRGLDEPFWHFQVLDGLAEEAIAARRWTEAEDWSTRSLAVARDLGHPFATANALTGLADTARARGDLPRATALGQESLALHWAQRNPFNVAVRLEGLAMVAAEGGQAERAARLFGAVEVLRAELGVPTTPRLRPACAAAAARARADLGEADFLAAWEAGRTMALAQAVAEALERAAGSPGGTTWSGKAATTS